MADPTDPDDALLDDFFSSMTPDWVSDSETTTTRTVVVAATKLYGDAMFGKLRGVGIDQGTNAQIKFVFYAPQTGGPMRFSVGSYSTPPTVEVRYREAVGIRQDIYIPDTGDEASLSSDGMYVLLPIPLEVKNSPGVYRAQARVLTGDGSEAARDEFMVLTNRGMWNFAGETTSDEGPPTLNEVRSALRDHPAANRLLGEYEFDAAEVGQAIVSAVQVYNAEFPIGGRNLDTISFPRMWRRQWLDGILGFLFETAGHYFRRGVLPYAAGGVSINDLSREKEYNEAATMHRQRFQQWASVEKTRQSVAAAWGSQGSGLSIHGYGGW